MANKWRLLLKAIETEEDHAIGIVKGICMLHNIIIDKEGPDNVLLEKMRSKENENGNLCGIRKSRRNNSRTVYAKNVQKQYTEYFSSEHGSLRWQHRYVQ